MDRVNPNNTHHIRVNTTTTHNLHVSANVGCGNSGKTITGVTAGGSGVGNEAARRYSIATAAVGGEGREEANGSGAVASLHTSAAAIAGNVTPPSSSCSAPGVALDSNIVGGHTATVAIVGAAPVNDPILANGGGASVGGSGGGGRPNFEQQFSRSVGGGRDYGVTTARTYAEMFAGDVEGKGVRGEVDGGGGLEQQMLDNNALWAVLCETPEHGVTDVDVEVRILIVFFTM